MSFSDAIDDALAQGMADDPSIILLGEDVRLLKRSLYARFGGRRVRDTPISESAFAGAALGAAMAGLRPVIDLMFVDFVGVAMDALLNHAAKLAAFSGGKWSAPLVLRAGCGGGYGDGGQHEQCLWGWLAHIPGLTVVVPSTPADAGGLMLAALQHDGPTIFLEHKLLSSAWLDTVGSGGRRTVQFDVPAAGARGPVPSVWTPTSIGRAAVVRAGPDLTIVSVAVGVHRSLEAAGILSEKSIEAEALDLRTIAPLDRPAICESAARTGRLLVVDEDYEEFGLSGEVAATLLEAGVPVRFGRVCTRGTIPYARQDEDRTLPSTERIVEAALRLME